MSNLLQASKSLIGSSYKPKTFSYQHLLPRLPIPNNQLTAIRYKRSLVPFLSAPEYEEASKKIDRFFRPNGLGEELRNRLQVLDDQEASKGLNWLYTLWVKKEFLANRVPTMIHGNWWGQFRDPVAGLGKGSEQKMVTEFQIQRSARFIAGLVDYSNQINNEEISPEVTKLGPSCMRQLKCLFGTSRIATSGCDRISSQWPCLSKHINVMYKNQIFNVQVIGNHGETCSVNALERQLWQVVQQVEETPVEQRQPSVGLLTTEHRDTWGPIRDKMENQTINSKSFKAIDDSLFMLSLDDYSSPLDLESSSHNIIHSKNGNNRWADKALQFIVENNGRAGVNGEHSPAEAVVPSHILDYILAKESTIADAMSNNANFNLERPTLLRWEVSPSVNQAIETAQKNVIKLISNLDAVLLCYDGYGSNKIKEAKCSSDAWFQMAYQLAYYRLNGKPCGTVEWASTRKFQAGRVDVIRVCSMDSVNFVKAWEDREVQMRDKLSLFDRAFNTHLENIRAASNGNGVDHYLLGLMRQMTLEESKSEEAEIFMDPSYEKSQRWAICATNTSPGDHAWGGYAAIVPEGYASSYAIGKERIRASFSSYKSCKDTESSAFRKEFISVLDEFGDVAERYLIKK
ncbi:acyltransferase ChoActase/COT/CPT [Pilaira anomala]|nr:acyltransferase ChoActase/COT/CPT [Pilaira anomala]